ncbi:MAG: glycoside hydrolase family 53 protein [Turicibacter sp.]
MEFIKGMDVSMISELEAEGAKYFLEGEETDLFEIFRKTGVNSIRLRLWNDPYDDQGNPYGGGTNDLETTIKLAKRIKDSNLDFILDFHYSDFWADPKKQVKPKAWKHLSGIELELTVYQYTLGVLTRLEAHGIKPSCVQVGNEITNGLLWDDGHINQLDRMAALLKAGITAVKDFDSSIRVMLHLDYGTDNPLYRNWFEKVEQYELDFDIIGMSYYPYWNGSLEALKFNMNDISERFNKDIIVAETAFGYTTDDLGCKGMILTPDLAKNVTYPISKDGQKEYLEALLQVIKEVNGQRGIGFIYWEPAWLPIKQCTWAKEAGCIYANDEGEIGNSWANQALFDEAGNANIAFELFKKY